jgi:hypothetical protein
VRKKCPARLQQSATSLASTLRLAHTVQDSQRSHWGAFNAAAVLVAEHSVVVWRNEFDADVLWGQRTLQRTWFGELKWNGELSTLCQKARQLEAGETVLHNGLHYPTLYTPKNSTLIEVFGIEPAEQWQLRTIIGEGEAKERHRIREKNRWGEAGSVSRDTYLTDNDLKRVEARTLSAKGMSQRQIASRLGVLSALSTRGSAECSKSVRTTK